MDTEHDTFASGSGYFNISQVDCGLFGLLKNGGAAYY